MHHDDLHQRQHSHSFGQEKKRPGELRTIIVIVVTATMMVVEISTGILFGSMALLADGLHMASHTAALGIAAFAYIYARRHAHDERYSFGTGKVNALGGFTGAVLLALFALAMAWESLGRLLNPVEIAFNQAIFVAVIGLLVNGASMLILGHHHDHGDGSACGHHHSDHHHSDHHHSDHQQGDHENCEHDHHGSDHQHHDHNLRAAYFHVLADALTSLLAIFALLAGKYFGLIWMDPLMGMVGAILVARWSLELLQSTGAILLDRQGPEQLRNTVRESIEQNSDGQVVDLHLWSIGPGIYAVELAIVTHEPQPPDDYREMLPKHMGLAHVNIEVHHCFCGNKRSESDAMSASF